MNYIGSKHKLLSFIRQTVYSVAGNDLSNMVFCDLFAGTGVVGRGFKTEVKSVIANDLEYYSYVLNQNYIGNYQPLNNAQKLIQELSSLTPIMGFIFKHYCHGGGSERQYFSDKNGMTIDAIRSCIENWLSQKKIDRNTYFFLLASLLESADKVANTASVYGAYLKQLKPTAQKPLVLKAAEFNASKNQHYVFNEDSNSLIYKIEGDILYLDPPYNTRQYGANYHLLNTIAKYDSFSPKGKTGQRDYKKSHYCRKRLVLEAFEELIKEARFKYIFLSYNNEGLMSVQDVKTIMSKYGKYDLQSTNYQRFKAAKTDSRNQKADRTEEYIHILEKN